MSRNVSSAEAPTVGLEIVDSGSLATITLDVEAVKRAVAPTISLDVAAVKQATSSAEAPTVAFAPVDPAAEDSSPEDSTSAELVTSDDDATTDDDADDLARTTPTHIATTSLSMPASGLVAVPETADDVIATIHAAATAVAAADRRARQAASVKADPWTGLDLHRPAAPAPVDNVLDLLAPVLERPLLVVEQPGPPEPADVVALHRAELAVEFVDPPVVAAGAEPPIPPRFGPGLSVLPHIEFPV